MVKMGVMAKDMALVDFFFAWRFSIGCILFGSATHEALGFWKVLGW
jgi:hypothetical protein